MTVSEALRAMDAAMMAGRWSVESRGWMDGSVTIRAGEYDDHGYAHHSPEVAAAIVTLRNALPLLADLVEAAEAAYLWFGDDDAKFYAQQKPLARALAALASELERNGGLYPASRPLDPKFPHHVEGCICPRFNDIAPALIADLTCSVHGVQGTDPGDKLGKPERDGAAR